MSSRTPVPAIDIDKIPVKKLVTDPAATAKAVQLVYVSSNEEGIIRMKRGKGFAYEYKNKVVKDKATLNRLRGLVLPPAWTEVWICALANGHLQATGKDAMNRKQYRYHPMWEKLRSKTKFYRMLELGKVLPEVRKQVQKDLSLPGIPQKKVLAAIVSLMEKTGIRIGNDFYEKLYGSFGLTTLKDKHVSIQGEKVKFCFRGKKGVDHEISLRSKKLARIVKQCRDIPGKELFQYVDGDGKRQVVDSGMVNDYIRSIADKEFTAKDLRTWCGSITALSALLKTGIPDTQKATKQKMLEVLDEVSGLLGNTRTVCKKYYVHPCLFDLYENGKLADWVDKVSRNGKPVENLAAEEILFIKILEGL